MVRSGIDPTPELLAAYNELQSAHKYHFITAKIDDKLIVLDQVKPKEEKFEYNDFVAALTGAGEARYGIVDYNYQDGAVTKSKVVFVLWSPDDGSPQKKLKYSSSKGDLIKKLTGVQKEMEAHDESEIEEPKILAKCLA
jgi:cofilin